MKHFQKGIAVGTVLALLLSVSVPVSAAGTAVSSSSHLVKVGELQQNGAYLTMAEDHEPTARTALRRAQSTLPASYDLRTENRVTPVKDQKSNGTCWAFGALGSAESNLLTTLKSLGTAFSSVAAAGQAVDLSEKHLVWFAFHGQNSGTVSQYAGADTFTTADTFNIGGSRAISVPTLARWYGAADESDLPYKTTASGKLQAVTDSSLQTISRSHLQNAVFLPEPVVYDLQRNGLPGDISYSSEARTAVKQAIMQQGAVSVGYHAPEDTAEQNRFYGEDTNGYYCNDKKLYYANHEVTLVGWDDNYAKENFVSTPQGDGAWLVKNSWGSSATWTSGKSDEGGVGSDGYFYLSYYDLSLSEPTSFEMENTAYKGTQTAHTYSQIYQYDGAGLGASVWSSDEPVQFANVFTAREDTQLQAVSVQAARANATATIDIYVNPTEGNPASGGHLVSLKKTFSDAGYYTVPLGSNLLLNKGDTFSVVEQVSYPEDGQTLYGVLVESGKSNISEDGYGVEISCTAGQSYYKEANAGWKDQAGNDRLQTERGSTTGNAAIKVFANAPAVQSSRTGQTVLPLGSARTFTVTSKTKPQMVCGNGAVAQLHVLKPWDASTGEMQMEVYGCGHSGEETGIYANVNGMAQRLFTVSLSTPPFTSDTTVDVHMRVGQTYAFRIVPNSSSALPVYTVGDGSVLSTRFNGSVRQADGRTAYYYSYRCLKPGNAGVYISIGGQAYRVFACTVTR
ncbi:MULTISPECIES: C1 family peptidase [Caproicibacterium]|uniref:Lectin like domain-containing protein n=1 Tax=Caproicibacterium argilliputei TaxID=3030016 RepID=A0AA97H197_9FIRM|nr:lectin like domain-containing protein [Caproicibacterium argilliputei]WOC32203.1 lectin like domain-containing protein [Caproicibacterium argilliputei]